MSSYPVCVCVCWLGTVVCLWLLHNLPAGVWLCRPAWCQLPDFSLPEHVPLPGISSRQKITHAHTHTQSSHHLVHPLPPTHASNPHSASLCSSRMMGGGLVCLKKISTDLSQNFMQYCSSELLIQDPDPAFRFGSSLFPNVFKTGRKKIECLLAKVPGSSF